MVIGIEAQRLFRSKKHGMEIVALEIIRQLQLLDFTNQYILFSKKGEDKKSIEHSSNFLINTSCNAAYPFWEQSQLPKMASKAKVDLLHCTANTAPLFSKIPVIITIHDVIYLESINFSGSPYQNFGNLYRRFIVPIVAKKAAIIITVSEFEKKTIASRLNISEGKIRVVYNGVNDQFKPITDQEKLAKFKIKYDLPEKFLLHFGNTAPKKNTIGVLSAYKLYIEQVDEPVSLVITDCTIVFITQLLKQINATGILKHIKILNYVSFDVIPYLYNLSTILLYPSHRESFGMPVIEAMACGVPVITSNTSALPEISGGAACLIDPANPAEISLQIMHILNNKAAYISMRTKGFVNAKRFSWEIAAKNTLSIYNEIGNIIMDEPINLSNDHKKKSLVINR